MLLRINNNLNFTANQIITVAKAKFPYSWKIVSLTRVVGEAYDYIMIVKN